MPKLCHGFKAAAQRNSQLEDFFESFGAVRLRTRLETNALGAASRLYPLR
jgi:hypothetical protein